MLRYGANIIIIETNEKIKDFINKNLCYREKI